MKSLKLVVVMLFAVMSLTFLATLPNSVSGSQAITEAPTTDLVAATDDLFNGFGPRGTPIDECVAGPVPNQSFEDNLFIFDELEEIDEGLGPTYNAPGCGDCHDHTDVGGISQIRELRAGHLSGGVFVNPPGGQSLIQLRSIAAAIQERLDIAPLENIRTFRTTLNTVGDGFVECIDSNTWESPIRSTATVGRRRTTHWVGRSRPSMVSPRNLGRRRTMAMMWRRSQIS